MAVFDIAVYAILAFQCLQICVHECEAGIPTSNVQVSALTRMLRRKRFDYQMFNCDECRPVIECTSDVTCHEEHDRHHRCVVTCCGRSIQCVPDYVIEEMDGTGEPPPPDGDGHMPDPGPGNNAPPPDDTQEPGEPNTGSEADSNAPPDDNNAPPDNNAPSEQTGDIDGGTEVPGSGTGPENNPPPEEYDYVEFAVQVEDLNKRHGPEQPYDDIVPPNNVDQNPTESAPG